MRDTISSSSTPTDPELPFGGGASATGSSSGDPEVVVIKGPPRPANYPSPLESAQEEKNNMNGSTPAALNVKRSIDRQRKEQRAVTSILSGVGLGLLLIIVGCATLSAFGGYVLWQQIQQQSVTVAQMEQKLNKEIAALQARDAELASGLEAAGAQLAKQLSSLEQIKSQVNRHDKDLGTVRQRLSMLEGDSGERRR
jgi:hypothetical protein